jgi:hypothetical protein
MGFGHSDAIPSNILNQLASGTVGFCDGFRARGMVIGEQPDGQLAASAPIFVAMDIEQLAEFTR